MSVPRPAIFVARVIAPFSPARATIAASCSLFLAFRRLYLIPSWSRYFAICSFFSIEPEPTKTGRPSA